MITDTDAAKLRAEYARLRKEMERSRNKGEMSLVFSYERSMARIEERLERELLDVEED